MINEFYLMTLQLKPVPRKEDTMNEKNLLDMVKDINLFEAIIKAINALSHHEEVCVTTTWKGKTYTVRTYADPKKACLVMLQID